MSEESDVCYICGEPFRAWHDRATGQELTDRAWIGVQLDGMDQQPVGCAHSDCIEHGRIWRRIRALEKRLGLTLPEDEDGDS